MYLCIKSDSPEVYVAVWDRNNEIFAESWEAGRELSNQILNVIQANCDKVAIKIEDLKGLLVYEGPGSYTGLRISYSVANSIAYSNGIPILGASGDNWIEIGLTKLTKLDKFSPVSPNYGRDVYTTKPKK